MAKLVVKRARDFSNAARKFTLLLDGREIGVIAHGGSEMFDVPPGSHTLKAKFNWLMSRDFEFNVNEGETRYVKVSGPPYEFAISVVVLVLMLGAFALRMKTGRDLMFYLLITFGSYRLGQFTIARKNYLRVKADEFYE